MQLMAAGSVETHDHIGGARLRVKLPKINRSGFEKTKSQIWAWRQLEKVKNGWYVVEEEPTELLERNK
jgi:hypothetical protein